ncbi:hypothetical protein [Sutcliffiella sp. NC1]|uniref:hypothetical protein n=1 Tax=Sutcliffiella sp. NC1 TaxID=3004096 RepID=UPI0022DD70AD|nr:hypothetical protein [Sutcliffiella sp. NC1]WBL16424.1 hypothetical protein O1A01_07260 [Sutcliffiella sp. NC1]
MSQDNNSQLEWQKQVLREELVESESFNELRKSITDRVSQTMPKRKRRGVARMEKTLGK